MSVGERIRNLGERAVNRLDKRFVSGVTEGDRVLRRLVLKGAVIGGPVVVGYVAGSRVTRIESAHAQESLFPAELSGLVINIDQEHEALVLHSQDQYDTLDGRPPGLCELVIALNQGSGSPGGTRNWTSYAEFEIWGGGDYWEKPIVALQTSHARIHPATLDYSVTARMLDPEGVHAVNLQEALVCENPQLLNDSASRVRLTPNVPLMEYLRNGGQAGFEVRLWNDDDPDSLAGDPDEVIRVELSWDLEPDATATATGTPGFLGKPGSGPVPVVTPGASLEPAAGPGGE